MDKDTDDYKSGMVRLTKYVARLHEGENLNSRSKHKKMLGEFAESLDQAASLMEDDYMELLLQSFHDWRGATGRMTGERRWESYRAIKWHIRELAESARQAVDEIPDPRKKFALDFAARGFLHLRHYYGLSRPSLYDGGSDISEFADLCKNAGIHLSNERYRDALRKSIKTFDPYFITGYEEIIFPQ